MGSRQRVFEALNAQKKQNACETIASWLKEADEKAGNPINSDDEYFSEAQRRIKGFRWQLHRLNRLFLWLEKKVIEPLDCWSDRANLFQFFAKVSPVIQVIGVLAIPFVLFYYENQRNEQQIKSEEQREERQLEFQTEVRQQQAVRDYLSQITTIYLNVENRDQIEQDEDLKNFLEATTLAIFDELSISENFQDESKDNDDLNQNAIERDRKGDVIDFLSKLGWINDTKEKKETFNFT
ncbi:MAG: hypothetical protein AAGA80_26905 [Cyanobacteria bacterium P01_F01_bin.143]